ncbi:MAG TPA: hypothetical protein VFH88_02820 [Candidatus Krumholzibacteria bacterium]|nr:hypothetical protein [Candidatus Krumholzibacteria bacterium]
MGRYDVLASWGHPVRRLSDGSGDEQWTYFDADIDSGDVMEYDLMFRRGVLDSWTRRPIRNGGLAYRTVPELPDQLTTDSPTDRPGGKRVPKN